ncbi:MAG TPA: hypothetical protein VGH74_15015, partial [Planctomycetaceae bacterium]
MGNPFARRDEVAQNAGQGTGTGTSTVGGAGPTGANPGVGANSADGQPGPGGTTIGGQGADGSGNVIGGQTGPVVDNGAGAARVGGDSTVGSGDSANPDGTGNSATGNSSSTGNAGNSTSGGNSGGTPTGSGNPLVATGNTTIGGNGSSSANTTIGNSGAKNSTGGGKAGGGPRASSPHIERRTRQETAFLPGWASQPRPAGNLTTLIVGAGNSGEGKFATLNEAFEHVPAAGALIKLAGHGPFPLYPVQIADKTRITIEPGDASNPASAPIIVLLPPTEGSVSNFIEFQNTTLDLRRIHLALDADRFDTAPDDALLSAVSSDLYLHDCSISVKGMPESPMTAVKITGQVSRSDAKAGVQPRVLIENTFIRGNKLTVLTINSEHLDLAARNALLWSGAATALRFGPIARSDADAARNVHLASTTLCSLSCAVQIAGDASQPVPTSFDLLNSLIAAPAANSTADKNSADGHTPVLLTMEDWNPNQQKTAFGKFINWKSTASLYTGWSTLIRLNPGAVASATNPAQWHAAWKDKDKGAADKDQFQESHWPGQRIADIAAAGSFDSLAPQTVGKQYVKTGEGGWPGCQTELLTVVAVDSFAPAPLAATRPALPKGLFQSTVRDVLRVDVTREDLGK